MSKGKEVDSRRLNRELFHSCYTVGDPTILSCNYQPWATLLPLYLQGVLMYGLPAAPILSGFFVGRPSLSTIRRIVRERNTGTDMRQFWDFTKLSDVGRIVNWYLISTTSILGGGGSLHWGDSYVQLCKADHLLHGVLGEQDEFTDEEIRHLREDAAAWQAIVVAAQNAKVDVARPTAAVPVGSPTDHEAIRRTRTSCLLRGRCKPCRRRSH
jgi:hypothetical protein